MRNLSAPFDSSYAYCCVVISCLKQCFVKLRFDSTVMVARVVTRFQSSLAEGSIRFNRSDNNGPWTSHPTR